MLDSILNTTYTILTSPLLLLTTLLILLSAYIALIIAYRLTFQPLAKYPGPKLAAITDIYLAYYAYRGTRHLCYHRAHEQYGPIVRIGPNQLSFISNSALKQIYGFRSNVKKAAFYDAFPATPSSVSVHSARDKAQHARKRRVMSHAFSDSAIKGLERYILANVRTACSMLATGEKGGAKGNASEKGRDGKEKVAGGNGEDGWVGFDGDGWTGIGTWNVAHWCNWLVFDIMGDLVFGKAFGMLESDANRFAIEMVGNAAHRHLIVSPGLHSSSFLLPPSSTSCPDYRMWRGRSATSVCRAVRLAQGLDRRQGPKIWMIAGTLLTLPPSAARTSQSTTGT